MASAAVAFTADPLALQSDCNARLENTSSGSWHRVGGNLMALKDVNVASQLNQVFYGTVGRCPSLQTPTPSPSSSDADVCLPETGTLALVEQFQCQTEEQYADELASASQAAAMLGGTLAAALLVYSLLPYVRARNRKRRRSRSRTHSQTNNDILRRCEDQQQRPSTPTTPNGASRRMWGSLEGDGIEPAGARRDERRERKSRQPEANGSAVSDAGSELLLAKLPDFNDERGWRDFFDSQIYHSEPEDEHRSPTKTFSGVKNRDLTPRTSIAATRSQLQRIKGTAAPAATTRSDRYRTIRERIDRAATEAAIDEAESFNEFWQL